METEILDPNKTRYTDGATTSTEQAHDDGGDDDGGKQPSPGTTSLSKSVFNMANSTVGVGTLTVPWCISQIGLVGLALLILVGLMGGYTNWLLVQSGLSLTPQRFSYSELGEAAYGRAGKLLVQILLILLCFGGMCSYMIVVGTLSQIAIVDFTPEDRMMAMAEHTTIKWFLSDNFICGLVALFIMLPLCMLRRLGALGFVSLLSLVAIVFCIVITVVFTTQMLITVDRKGSPVEVVRLPISLNFVNAFTAIVFSFVNQFSAPDIVKEMANKTPGRIIIMLSATAGVCITCYWLIGIPTYLLFRHRVCEDILLNFQFPVLLFGTSLSTTLRVEKILFGIGSAAMVLSVALSAPLTLFPLRAALHDICCAKLACYVAKDRKGANKTTLTFFVLEGILILVAAYIVSVVVNVSGGNLTTITSITGGVAGSGLMFVLPGLFYLRLKVRSHPARKAASFGNCAACTHRALAWAVTIWGIFVILLTLLSTGCGLSPACASAVEMATGPTNRMSLAPKNLTVNISSAVMAC